MQRSILTGIIFTLFVLEGTILKWMLPVSWQTIVIVEPHLVFIAILMAGLYVNRYMALICGFSFGLLHDIVYYGPMIGTYMALYGIIGYLIGWMASRTNANILTGLFWIVTGLFLFEWCLYGIYIVFRITQTGVHWVFMRHILPSVLINLMFALLIYVPLRNLLESIRESGRKDAQT